MRIRNLNVGVESISTWTVADELHLPDDVKGVANAFIPELRPLQEVLKRPTLDERLPMLLQPDEVSPELFVANRIAEVRVAARDRFAAIARRSTGSTRKALMDAAAQLETDRALDEDVRAALAVLMRG